MKLHSYISFDGNCEQAIEFYKDVLNAEVTTFMRFEDAPEGTMPVPDHAKKLVMHATLEFDGNTFMCSDHMNPDFIRGNTYSMSINAHDEEAHAVFKSLLEGGHKIMPFEEVFWGGKFGMLVDKFGVQWMVSSDHKPT